MTPDSRAVLCATPASDSGQASRAHTVADAADVDIITAQVALDLLVGQGLVERETTWATSYYCRTEKGDRVAEGGR